MEKRTTSIATKWQKNLRIIWAIAEKDITNAIKNKTVQGIVIGVLLMMVTGRALPILMDLADVRTLVYYDEGKSRLMGKLKNLDGVRLHRAPSWEALVEAVGTSGGASLGLVLPASFDQAIEAGQPPALSGHVVHWAKRGDVADLKRFFEAAFAETFGQAVQIAIKADRIYPGPDAGGFTGMAAGVIVMIVITVGIFLTPHLIVDERQTKTMDALLISPASIGQVIAGKAIAGAAYCLAAAGVAVAFNSTLVVNWSLAILAVVCGAFFAVAVGLLIGSFFQLPQNMNAVTGILMVVLLLPPYFIDVSANWPPGR